MPPRKSLFSRSQLNWIIIVLSALIALLSLNQGASPWPTLARERIAGVELLFATDAAPAPPLLRLSLQLPPQLDAGSPLAAALERLLRGQLADPAEPAALIGPQRLPDRVHLTLDLTAGSDPLLRLLERLAQLPSSAQFEQQQHRLSAALHLAASAPQDPLWPRTIAPAADLAVLYRNWISRQQLRLISNAPLSAPLRSPLQAALARLPAGQPWTTTLAATAPHDRPSTPTQASRLQLFRTLPGRSDPDYDLTQLAIQWLRPAAEANQVALDWQPRRHASRLGLTATGVAIDPAQLLLRLQQATRDDPQALARLGATLRQRLQHGLEQPLQRLDLLETVAVYDLPLDALMRFDATIAALEDADASVTQQLHARLRTLLDPAAFIPTRSTALGESPR